MHNYLKIKDVYFWIFTFSENSAVPRFHLIDGISRLKLHILLLRSGIPHS